MSRIPVTILGATGVVGQRFVQRLAQHPQFRIQHLAASERSAGRAYADACSWRIEGEAYGGLGDRVLVAGGPDTAFSPVVFSALDSAPAAELEPAFARAGALVFSNASAFRMEADVPLLVPEVNPEHLALLAVQRERRGWTGGILCNPNCTATVLVMALAPLQAAFGIEAVMMTSLQAISGAGYPGVASLDILGNVVPFIRNEEEKVEEETPKLLGLLEGGRVRSAPLVISALCHRVPVVDGHTEAVSVRLRGNPSVAQVREALAAWKPLPQALGLPTAPVVPIRLHTAEDRPQVRRDVEQDGGMSVHVGRIRACPLLGIKFSLLGHNTHRGAAGGSLLNAELALHQGWIR
ncbi:MAG: aspartate-semialdehyde dehydrogenase [Acidobacteria bacterium]|nr:aspartate-semialdehyde dehydrogenase [Acidobacteriota bacterium]